MISALRRKESFCTRGWRGTWKGRRDCPWELWIMKPHLVIIAEGQERVRGTSLMSTDDSSLSLLPCTVGTRKEGRHLFDPIGSVLLIFVLILNSGISKIIPLLVNSQWHMVLVSPRVFLRHFIPSPCFTICCHVIRINVYSALFIYPVMFYY